MTKDTERIKRFKWKWNTNWFKQNPNNINKKGAPKKLLNNITDQLKEKWVKMVSKKEIEDVLSLLFNLNENDLKELLQDKETPMILRVIIKNLISNKWFYAINSLLDRVFWKATQTNNNINIEATEEIDLLKDRLKNL